MYTGVVYEESYVSRSGRGCHFHDWGSDMVAKCNGAGVGLGEERMKIRSTLPKLVVLYKLN